MKSFGMVFWITEENDLFNLVWDYAVSLFKKTKSAESVMFWYILLNKLGLLANLYEKDRGVNPLNKKSTGPQSKMQNFLKKKKVHLTYTTKTRKLLNSSDRISKIVKSKREPFRLLLIRKDSKNFLLPWVCSFL